MTPPSVTSAPSRSDANDSSRSDRSRLGRRPREIIREHPNLFAALLLAILGFIAYANALPNAFHFDDIEGIVRNRMLYDLRNIPLYFTDPAIFRFTTKLDWRPILQITYALDYAMGGLNPAVFNATNLSFHIATAWLIFLIVARIDAGAPVRLSLAPPSRAWLALTPAILFLVHTVNTQTVDYAWARSSLLAAFFYLLAFYCFLRGPFGGPDGNHRKWHAGALAAFALALGCKATAVSFPGMILVYEALVLDPERRNPLTVYWREPRRLVKYLPTIAVLLGYIALRAVLMPHGTANHLVGRQWFSRSSFLFTQFRAWVYYIRLYFWPDPLILDYPGFGWSFTLWDRRVLFSLAVILSIAIAAWIIRRSEPLITFFACWFFIALLPEASVIIRPDAVNGHRPYLAYVGLSVVAALILLKTAAWFSMRRKSTERGFAAFYATVFGLVVIALTVATISRNRVWRDEITLWTDVIQKDPTNVRAFNNLGLEYMTLEEYEKADALLNRAVQLAPRNAEAYTHRGNLNLTLGRFDQALSDLNTAIGLRRVSPFAFYYRAEVYRQTGRYEEALKDYDSALRAAADFADAYYGKAILYWEMKDLPQATAACRKLLTIEPENMRSYHCLGSLLMHDGNFKEALTVYRNGVGRFPRNGALWYGLGTAYEELGLYKEAEAAYDRSRSELGRASPP